MGARGGPAEAALRGLIDVVDTPSKQPLSATRWLRCQLAVFVLVALNLLEVVIGPVGVSYGVS